MKEESVYFGQLLSRSRALRHTGDELTGEADLGQGDDEVIVIDLPNLPSQLCALHFIATVSTEGKSFADVKTARMRLVNWKTGHEECRFSPASAGAHTAIFFARLARKSHSEPWVLQTIGEADHTARDWGTLVPELQMYTRDLVPGLQVRALLDSPRALPSPAGRSAREGRRRGGEEKGRGGEGEGRCGLGGWGRGWTAWPGSARESGAGPGGGWGWSGLGRGAVELGCREDEGGGRIGCPNRAYSHIDFRSLT